MPYIKKEDRERLLNEKVGHVVPKTAGELNYLITMVCLRYLVHKGTKYETFNTIIGALQCAMMEFYRKVVSKYEDKKKDENGDIF